MGKTFKILSIDGGGIKGLYSAQVLARIEKSTGKSIGDHFDMICGTSTGGLIALGLSVGKSAEELVTFYTEKGPKIFPTVNARIPLQFQRGWQFAKQLFIRGKFTNKELKNTLNETFGDQVLGDSQNLLCIPSFRLIKGEPTVFKFPHKEGGFYRDRDMPMVDAALATSAAPTYFPIHEYDDELFVDGGIWANNPSLCGLLEALKFFVGPEKEFDTFDILSIASIEKKGGLAVSNKKKRSFRHWGSKLFESSMGGQAFFHDYLLSQMIENIQPAGTYYRIPSPSLSEDQIKHIDMDLANDIALKTLKTLGKTIGDPQAVRPEVLKFFETEKEYKTH